MQNATFYNLVWEKGTVAHVEEFKPHEKRPSRSSLISENKYLVPGTPAKLHLIVIGEDGKQYSNNIYRRILKKLNRKMMSEKLYNTLYQQYEKANFTVEHGLISWECDIG